MPYECRVPMAPLALLDRGAILHFWMGSFGAHTERHSDCRQCKNQQCLAACCLDTVFLRTWRGCDRKFQSWEVSCGQGEISLRPLLCKFDYHTMEELYKSQGKKEKQKLQKKRLLSWRLLDCSGAKRKDFAETAPPSSGWEKLTFLATRRMLVSLQKLELWHQSNTAIKAVPECSGYVSPDFARNW